MIDINFENLLALVPLDDEMKKSLEEKNKSFDQDQQAELMYLLWGMYRTYRSLLTEQLREKYTKKMIDEISALPEDFETYIEKQVDTALKEKLHTVEETEELAEVRSKLQAFIHAEK